jgi:hypothetical protein
MGHEDGTRLADGDSNLVVQESDVVESVTLGLWIEPGPLCECRRRKKQEKECS